MMEMDLNLKSVEFVVFDEADRFLLHFVAFLRVICLLSSLIVFSLLYSRPRLDLKYCWIINIAG